MKYERIICKIEGGVAWLIMNRPEVHNAIDYKMRRDLIDAFKKLNDDSNVRVLVVAGNGDKAFSVGADKKEFGTAIMHKGWDEWNLVGSSPKPVISAIHGYCLGAALQMALRSDIRIAANDALIGLPEIKLGVMTSDGGSQRLARFVGVAKTMEMMLSGEYIDAKEAYDFNMINRIVNKEELTHVVEKLAHIIASSEPSLIKKIKMMVYQGIEMPLDAALQIEKELASSVITQRQMKNGG